MTLFELMKIDNITLEGKEIYISNKSGASLIYCSDWNECKSKVGAGLIHKEIKSFDCSYSYVDFYLDIE